jgi:hypothetical protein
MKITGKCLCGSVAWTVEDEPILQIYCHCHSCQKAHSAVLASVAYFPSESISMVGELVSQSVTDIEYAAIRHSCAQCGSRVMNTPGGKGNDHMRGIFPVLCDAQDWFDPAMHIFYEERTVDVDDGLPKFLDLPTEFNGSGKMA